MRAVVIHSAVVCVVLGLGPAGLSAVEQQTATPAAQAKPKPAAEKEKQNRPKPENQPGAVKDAEKLAASHAGHHEMKKLEGGGVLPEGWHHRFDLPDMKLEDLRFVNESGGLHVTSGPPGIYYNPATTATGDYVVKATFTQLSKGEHREGYGPFIGGADLEGEGQKYLYFLLRQDGQFLIKQRTGTNTTGISDWTPHRAIKPFGADGKMTNELAIAVTADKVRFLINGTEVAQKPRAELNTDGIVGLRVNHQLDLAIKGFAVQR
jgi:hypothetical protein